MGRSGVFDEKRERILAELEGPAPINFVPPANRDDECSACGHPRWNHDTGSGACNGCVGGPVCLGFAEQSAIDLGRAA